MAEQESSTDGKTLSLEGESLLGKETAAEKTD